VLLALVLAVGQLVETVLAAVSSIHRRSGIRAACHW
jgi:hypothetical protein